MISSISKYEMKVLIHSAPIVNAAAVEVRVWITNITPYFIGHVIYLSMLGENLIHDSKRDAWWA